MCKETSPVPEGVQNDLFEPCLVQDVPHLRAECDGTGVERLYAYLSPKGSAPRDRLANAVALARNNRRRMNQDRLPMIGGLFPDVAPVGEVPARRVQEQLDEAPRVVREARNPRRGAARSRREAGRPLRGKPSDATEG
jgi:hypothetical protein